MAERSGVRIELDAASLPFFPGALEQAEAGVRTGGDRRNRDFAGPHVEADGRARGALALAYDPQTAGGLLVSLPADKAPVLQAEFGRGSCSRAAWDGSSRDRASPCADRGAAPRRGKCG